MSVTASVIGKGTTLGHATTSGGSYTSFAEVVECDLPEVNIGNVDATHYLSASNATEKKSVIWQDISEVNVTANYLKAETTTFFTIVGVEGTFFKITIPDGTTTGSIYVFQGFISKLGGGPIPNKDVIRQKFTITVTGPVVFTAGT